MSDKYPPTTEHNHEKKLRAMLKNREHHFQSGTEVLAITSHDSWCNIFSGGFCNCDPDIRFQASASIVNPN